jgi:hypothetical protein
MQESPFGIEGTGCAIVIVAHDCSDEPHRTALGGKVRPLLSTVVDSRVAFIAFRENLAALRPD